MEHKKKRRYTRPAQWEMKEFREFLGPVADNYNALELHDLYRDLHEMARILLDLYHSRRGSNPEEV